MPSYQEIIKVLVPRLPSADKLLPYIEQIDKARIYSNYGPLSREFSTRLGALVGTEGVTLTSNGTTAIELALRIRAKPAYRYCLMPAFTFIASAHAVRNAGLTPYLLDVDPETFTLTPAIAEAALALMDESPAAVLVISAFGAPPDQSAWAIFEATHGIPVVFDAAAAVTALSNIGSQPACVSLHATKVLGIGEGGAILSADKRLTDRATAMTGFGFLGRERVAAIPGGNYRISEYSAAVGLAVMDGLETRLAVLRELTSAYDERLSGKRTFLQRGVGSRWVSMTLNVVVPADNLAETLNRLDENKIEWRRWWGLGCHHHPAFSDLPRAHLNATENVAPCLIGIPFHDELSSDDLDRVTSCLP